MGNSDNWNHDHNSDKLPNKPKKKIKLIYLVPIFAVLGIVGFAYVWQNMYNDTSKCDDEITQVNQVINSTGSIDANDTLFQQLGTDGCVDISKATGMITTPLSHLNHSFKP
jgi:flagellar basal body-associated protein FliL